MAVADGPARGRGRGIRHGTDRHPADRRRAHRGRARRHPYLAQAAGPGRPMTNVRRPPPRTGRPATTPLERDLPAPEDTVLDGAVLDGALENVLLPGPGDEQDPAQQFVARLRSSAADFAEAAGAESAVVREAVPPARHRRARCRLVLRYATARRSTSPSLGPAGRPGRPSRHGFDRQILRWLGAGLVRDDVLADRATRTPPTASPWTSPPGSRPTEFHPRRRSDTPAGRTSGFPSAPRCATMASPLAYGGRGADRARHERARPLGSRDDPQVSEQPRDGPRGGGRGHDRHRAAADRQPAEPGARSRPRAPGWAASCARPITRRSA